jgi:hypothetical protein
VCACGCDFPHHFVCSRIVVSSLSGQAVPESHVRRDEGRGGLQLHCRCHLGAGVSALSSVRATGSAELENSGSAGRRSHCGSIPGFWPADKRLRLFRPRPPSSKQVWARSAAGCRSLERDSGGADSLAPFSCECGFCFCFAHDLFTAPSDRDRSLEARELQDLLDPKIRSCAFDAKVFAFLHFSWVSSWGRLLGIARQLTQGGLSGLILAQERDRIRDVRTLF